ncbi:MAG: type II 3-dehydroquinate dehydratase [Methylococcales bacterium]|nr:type II 3-dehydroquinate dehydratase [Methylococcales bacterium]
MANIAVINGPNLNLLGLREPKLYGAVTLPMIEQRLKQKADILGHALSFSQHNAEHELIERVQHAYSEQTDFIILNPAAYTHTSIALRDALLATQIRFIEVHLSNIHAREAFRHHSYFSDIAQGVILGLGAVGYELALDASHRLLTQQ